MVKVMSMFTFKRSALLGAVSVVALSHGAFAQDGFLISIDGAPLVGDTSIATTKKKTKVAQAKADIKVLFDGLEIRPRLDAVVLNGTPPSPGEIAKVQSQMNYPAFVTRGEIRVMDLTARGGPRLMSVVPVDANGTASFPMPDGNIAFVHRVYDSRGRYDETGLIPLRASDRPALDTDLVDPPEEGVDFTNRRRIPVYGGAVTVRGTQVRQGATVTTLGETITPDPSGSFVIQRILPAGDQAVAVNVNGAGENTYLEYDINIPRSEWFYTGLVDLTFQRRFEAGADAAGEDFDENISYGRIAGYAKGKTQSGWTLTGSIDTGEEELDELFNNLDKKDPYNVLLRMQRENAYPEYGDDSTIEDGAPTDGKFYLKAEKDGNHVLWGNYKSTVSGGYYLRNERQLYGFQGRYLSAATTSRGQARVALEAYAASPDNLPGRDVFRGTGGSVYFLQRQDISVGSETITVELRDKTSGRVVETRVLTEGRDYQINYLQGRIILAAPLTGSTGSGSVVTQAGGDYDVQLAAQYEYTPTAGDIDGMAFGGRAEAWVTDKVRLGFTGLVEQTDFADQTSRSLDFRYEHSDRTFLDLEYAESTGPGFGSSFSSDGGLIINNTGSAGNDGTGEAYYARGQVDLEELGLKTPGTMSAYYEKRTDGFSTLDYQTTDEEELWGLSIDMQPRENLSWRVYYDDYHNESGDARRKGGAELSFAPSDLVQWDIGVEHYALETPGGSDDDNGNRTDVAVRLTMTPSEVLSWYVFGQATVARSGGFEKNDRLGVGVEYRFAENWTVEAEVSDGSQGTAGQAIVTYQSDGYDSTYFGYRLEPGREFSGVTLRGNDNGQFVAGGKRRVSENVDIFGENTYDMFGRHKSLSSAYGVEYRTSELLTLLASLEVGEIDDSDGDFTRRAISLGFRYSDGERLNAKGRLEYRRDRGDVTGTNQDQDAFFLATSARYKISDNARLLFNLEYADNDSDNSSILSGEYIDATVGYAYRPVLDDKLNVLFKYRYLYDMIGQEVDGSEENGPRQESHVVSLDADYDLNTKWTIGGKLGGRWSRSSPDDSTPLQKNDAWLGVLNARYHFTHKWDVLLEGRYLEAKQAGLSEFGVLGAAYRHVGNNTKIGVGYNFGNFSDDLTDLTYNDEGVFLNLIAKF